MRKSLRIVLTVVAGVWAIALLLWVAWLRMPHLIQADHVSKGRWRHARRAVALPISWQAGRGRPPLLPTSGDLFTRQDEAMLNGAAIVPGTFDLSDATISLDFRPAQLGKPGRLSGPLLPTKNPAPRQRGIPPARGVELFIGVTDPAQFERQGLHLRWDENLTVFGVDNQTPLFPGRKARMDMPPGEWHQFSLSLKGKHVICRIGKRALFDFHLTKSLKGAVGIISYEGCIALRHLDVTEPEMN